MGLWKGNHWPMTEKNWRRVTGWAAIIVGILAAVLLLERLRWLFDPILATLAPFAIAFFAALVLNPLIARLERRGMRRAYSVGLTSLLFLMIFAGTILLLVPMLIDQGTDLARNVPDYARTVQDRTNSFLERESPLLRRFNLPTTLPGLTRRFSDQLSGFSSSALKAVSGFFMASVGRMTWLFIIPLVTIWLLMNWDRQRDKFQCLLPVAHKDRIIKVLQSVGRVLNSYVRGAVILAVLYGAVTAFVLGVIFRMPYALVLGLIAGLASPIPYIGSILILVSTTLVAYATHPSVGYVLAVLGAMMLQNNVLFDNVLAPRILGGAVGLSLPWSIFALMLGGSMFGIAGMILAVPVGASINVLLMEVFPKLQSPEPEESKPEEPDDQAQENADSS